jgi:hypothetical protein
MGRKRSEINTFEDLPLALGLPQNLLTSEADFIASLTN